MKKLILTVIAVLSVVFVNAQDGNSGTEGFSKGDLFISGSIGFNSSSTGNDKNQNFNITPRLGYFASQNFAIGGLISLSNSSVESPGRLLDNDTNGFAIGAFGRYYATPANKFSVFGELNATYSTNVSKNNLADQSTDFTVNTTSITVLPGVHYFLNKNFIIEANWGVLSYFSTNPDIGDNTNGFSIALNLANINLGLVYKF